MPAPFVVCHVACPVAGVSFARRVDRDIAYKSAIGPSTAVLTHLLPAGYHKWIPFAVGYTCKALAVTIAWKIQAIISAVQSAIRGGLMISRGGMRYLCKRGVLSIDPDDVSRSHSHSLAHLLIKIKCMGKPVSQSVVSQSVSQPSTSHSKLTLSAPT